MKIVLYIESQEQPGGNELYADWSSIPRIGEKVDAHIDGDARHVEATVNEVIWVVGKDDDAEDHVWIGTNNVRVLDANGDSASS